MADVVANIIRQLFDSLVSLAERASLKVVFQGSARGALAIAGCTGVGGLVCGPAGMGVGGVAGSLAVSYTSRGTFEPIATVIRKLSPSQKAGLINYIKEAFMSSISIISASDIVELLKALITGKLTMLIIQAIKKYFNNAGYAMIS